MRRITTLLIVACSLALHAAEPGLPSTAFTRGLLRAADAAAARAALQLASTNVALNIQPDTSDFDTNGLILTSKIGRSTAANWTNKQSVIEGRTLTMGDIAGESFGKEYLYAWRTNRMARGAPVISLVGDSTTAGDGITDTAYRLDQLLYVGLLGAIANPTIYNDAVSGSTIETFITNTLPTVTNRVPNLIIMRFGVNNGGAAYRAAFEADLRYALATIRSNLPLYKTSILLMTPNGINDVAGGRDVDWLRAINLVIRKAARDYNCAFLDTSHQTQDAASGWGLYMAQDYAFPATVHPLESENVLIADQICDVLLPYSLVRKTGTANWRNSAGAWALAATLAPTNWDLGGRIDRATLANGYPCDGQAITFRQNDGIWLQLNNAYATDDFALRTGQTSGFGRWLRPLMIDQVTGYTSNDVYIAGANVVNIGNNAGNAGSLRISPPGGADALTITGTSNPQFINFYSTTEAAILQRGAGSITFWINSDRKVWINSDGTVTAASSVNATNGFNVGPAVGITTNLNVICAGPLTNQLQFTGGILTGVVPQ